MMKVAVVYTSVTNGPLTFDFASRFIATWHEFPPLVECDLIVGCNGGPPPTDFAVMFNSLNARFFPRVNDASWDIGLYLDAARGPCADYDMMVCIGESNYFHREGWLKRFVEAWKKFGPGMYGPYGTNVARAHLQTTAFCCSPLYLRQYQTKVKCRQDRYEFEHGERSLWRRLNQRGVPVRLVTWDGEWESRAWRVPRNIIWRGDQSNCLMWCNHTDGFRDSDEQRKQSWSRSADRPYK